MAQLRQGVTANAPAITGPVVELSSNSSLLENSPSCIYSEHPKGLHPKLHCYEMIAVTCMESARRCRTGIPQEQSSKSTRAAENQYCISSRRGRAGILQPRSSAIRRETYMAPPTSATQTTAEQYSSSVPLE